jgi:hypothetical protein
MGHCFSLGIEHGVENEMLNPSRLGSCDRNLTNGDLVRADIGANVVNRANILNRSLHRLLGFHVTYNNILRAPGFDSTDLFGLVDEGAHWRASLDERLKDTLACFAC